MDMQNYAAELIDGHSICEARVLFLMEYPNQENVFDDVHQKYVEHIQQEAQNV